MNTKTAKQRAVMTDGEIIGLFWERNEVAIDETDKKYGPFLFRMAYNILQDAADSEECQNDTYLGIWNTIPPHRPEVFSSFIARIMRNTAIKKLKEKRRQKRVPSEMVVSMNELEEYLEVGGRPDDEYAARELGRVINEFLGGLNERQRFVFIGRYYMGDKLETLAKALGVNASTVYRELEKLKQQLKIQLERSGIYV